MVNAELMEAIKRSGAVPSMPQVVMRFLEIIQDPEFQYDDLVAVLSTDPGTASEVLRMSNSALFGVARKITSLKQAMTLLGPRRVRSLVLGRYMVEAIGARGLGSLDENYFWRRSLACAVVTTRFADLQAPNYREEAFIAALLADIGIVILAEELPSEYQPIIQLFAPMGEANLALLEKEALGITHGEVSAAVLEHWQLPEIICEAVARHQLDITAATEPTHLARIINAADQISKLLCESPDSQTLVQDCQRALSMINLDLATLCEILDQVEIDVTEFASLLHIPIVPSSTYQLIRKAINDALAPSAVYIAPTVAPN
ncbi:MAG: hypothetical protein HJJLKODD_02095 [Phycisphaerae bacterium]|nr:hypothetical protein [Phycisphaerae bacterium]